MAPSVSSRLVVHEGGCLGEIGRRRPVLDGETFALAHYAPRSAGDLGHDIGAEALDDLVERAGHRLKRCEPLDQLVAAGDGLPALDGLAVAINRPRRQIALAVRERLVELHREGMGEIVEDIFPRRDVDAHVVPFLGRDFCQAPFHQGFAGRHDLDDGGVPVDQVLLDGADQRRGLHAGQEMTEEALLGALEG